MPKRPLATQTTQGFPGRRWLIVGLRGLHLMAVIGMGALLLGAPAHPAWPFGAVASAVLASGLAMFILDVIADRNHLRSVAGISMLIKMALVAGLAVHPEAWLFWVIAALSAVVSHAPASFRHREIY